MVKVAKTLERAAVTCNINFVGGFSALVHKAATPSDLNLIRSLPRALKDWLICVRKPALSLRYRMEKRHVPDLDAEPAVRGDSAATSAGQADTTTSADTPAISRNAPSDAPEAADSPSAPKAPVKGKNSDLMTVTGGFTIRYFDLAAGMLGMLLAGCLFRGCCWMKRQMK
jgi:hypothetical protein